MGLFEFLIVAVIIMIACALAVLALRTFAPNHPAYVEGLLWGVGVFIILAILANAAGLLKYDVPIPRLR